MSTNPYAAPEADLPPSSRDPKSREHILGVAKAQRGVLVCILLYLGAAIGSAVAPPEVQFILGLAFLIAAIAGAVFVFMLSVRVYGTGMGIFLGLLTLVPLLGLLVLLIVNSKATKILKEHGIKVGLLGANTSKI